MRKKRSTPAEVLCAGLPSIFKIFLNYARNLPFEAQPDYSHLRHLFHETFNLAGYSDHIFEWSTMLPSRIQLAGQSHADTMPSVDLKLT